MNHLYKFYLPITCVAFIAGVLFCALYNRWIIIQFPTQTTYDTSAHSSVCKKQVTLHYMHHDKWKVETQERLWTDNDADNIMQLINAWLALLYEEQIFTKKITLQSALLSQSGTAYLSFDHTIFGKEDPIFSKWILIEGLLKTLKENGIRIHHVQFLVQHQPLNDLHLDFSLAWPIQGFNQN